MLSILKSIGAVLAGAFVGIALSLGTDSLMHALHLFSPIGQPMTDSRLLALATVYRTIYGVLGAYVTAWLAPSRPMLHAMILGALGMLAAIVGVVATWNDVEKYGPHWYPIALVLLALPPAWLGAWLYERRAQIH
jgi:predicted ribosomally synthesized peptide with SipW-like signal peptide